MRDTRYDINDTIFAVSSPSSDQRVIFRITGSNAVDICKQIWKAPLESPKVGQPPPYILPGSVTVDAELNIDARLYVFFAPHSYTGDDVAEIHTDTNPAITEALIKNLLECGLRMAEPGEFTARAFLNGKIDLAQAEAVNEIIFSTNEYQLSAAEKLRGGRLGKTTEKLRENLMECLSLIEAGLDFSGEDIEFITRDEAIDRLVGIRTQLEQLLSSSIQYETVIDLPAVGIAGSPNAGKSTLLNKLLDKERSIVSDQHKTTRDVLTRVCQLAHCQCVLFDCAGLVTGPDNILDELAQQAAIEALRNSNIVIFCVNLSKTDWSQDAAVHKLIEPKFFLPVATKCDLLSEQILPERLAALNELFSADFLPISAHLSTGIESLRETIDTKLTDKFNIPRTSGIALTVRHRQAVTDAMGHVNESIDELKAGNDEVAALLLRAAYQAVSDIRQPIATHIDEQILEQIFNRFCIGK
jgi:tRNA modification GTPase